ncbi:MAG TPA: hypothetical protein VK171_12880, partial [Fimbriimonas sp.]|nr:hypothetical protein [Fimbriimonas sp.]
AEQVANSNRNAASGFWLYKIYNLNPLATLSQAYRKILLAPIDVKIDGKPAAAMDFPLNYVIVAGVFSFALMVFGYWLFNRLKWKFVERP